MTDRPLTREQAGAELRRLVASVKEADPEAAAQRLLERIAAHEDAEELRAALVLAGATVAAVLGPTFTLDLGDPDNPGLAGRAGDGTTIVLRDASPRVTLAGEA